MRTFTELFVCRVPGTRNCAPIWHLVTKDRFPSEPALCGAAPEILWSSELGEQISCSECAAILANANGAFVQANQPAARRPRLRPGRLLILACSAVKTNEPHPVPALRRYNGPLWQTLRTTDPEGSLAQVAFLSAEHGFKDASCPILTYDKRLIRAAANQMIAGGIGGRWPPAKRKRPPGMPGGHAACEIDGMRRAAGMPLNDIALVGGSIYLDVMRAFVDGFQSMGAITGDARIVEIQDQIGLMRKRLRAWLLEGPPAKEPAVATAPVPPP